MERNDIAPYAEAKQGAIFEHLLATPPVTLKKRFKEALSKRSDDWDERLAFWTPSTIALKSLSDCVNRRGIMTQVYTFLSPHAVEPINKWLIRKGISVPVYYYSDVSDLAYDLVFDRSIHVVYTPKQEDAMVLGIRATLVSPNTIWNL